MRFPLAVSGSSGLLVVRPLLRAGVARPPWCLLGCPPASCLPGFLTSAIPCFPPPPQSLTSASLAACSDAITQRLLGARLLGARRLSLRRMLLMAAFGLLWYGPTNHTWQALLVSLFPPPSRGLDGSTSWVLWLVRLGQRVAADQLLYDPLNNGLMILYVALVADRRPWAAAKSKLVAELPGVQRRGWRLWPAVQLVNQSLVPLEVCSCCCCWRCSGRRGLDRGS